MTMETDNPYSVFLDAIVRIYDKYGDAVGSGVLISKQYVLSCAHVIARALNLLNLEDISTLPSNLIELDFPQIQSSNLSAKVVIWQPEAEKDVAVLELQGAIPEKAQPIQLKMVAIQDLYDHSAEFFGFPEKHDNQGVWASVILRRPEIGTNWVQIEDDKETGYPVLPGFSGAPVWDNNLSGIVGLIVSRDKYLPEAKVGYMIPTEKLQQWLPQEFFPKVVSIQEKIIDDRYQPIIEAFMFGNVVPVLGAGINPRIYIDLAKDLNKEIGRELLGEDRWNSLEGKRKSKELIKQLIGLPCAACHYFTGDRPPPCPMIEEVTKDETSPLYVEQELAIAKMNLRSLSQYYKLKKKPSTFYKKLRHLSEAMEKPGDLHQWQIHQFFAELPQQMRSKGYPRERNCVGLPFQLIVTTNYDSWLEQAFYFYANGQPFDIVFYVSDGEGGRFMHKPYEQEAHLIPDRDYDEFPIPKPRGNPTEIHPIILQLYGRWDNNFVIADDHFNDLLRCLKKLPTDLIDILQESNLLFLGYSPSDYEIQMIVDRCLEEKILNVSDTPGSTSWLIHQSQPGELGKKLWDERRKIKPISIQGSLAQFVFDLKTGITMKIEKETKKNG